MNRLKKNISNIALITLILGLAILIFRVEVANFVLGYEIDPLTNLNGDLPYEEYQKLIFTKNTIRTVGLLTIAISYLLICIAIVKHGSLQLKLKRQFITLSIMLLITFVWYFGPLIYYYTYVYITTKYT